MSFSLSPSVTIIILNWNAEKYLANCLNAVEKLDYANVETIVVDNASTDNSITLLKEQFPHIKRIQNQTNEGYSAGNNVALRELNTAFALILNPDIVVSPTLLQELISTMLADPTIGIAGCKLTYPNSKLLQHAGGYLTPPLALPNHFGLREEDKGQFDVQREVDYVIGAAIAIRKEVFQSIGLLDEGYFLYFEEVDFCTRARRAGYRIVYVPTATAVHEESVTISQESDVYLQTMYSSRWRYLLKHYPMAQLFNQTIPAERERLATLSAQQQHAAAFAYWQTVKNLTPIGTARVQDGMPPISTKDQSKLGHALQELHKLAWMQPDWRELEEEAMIEERPFTSNIPLIGHLIATIRTIWNNIGTTQYMRPLLKQQNRFNQAVVTRLETNAAQLYANDDRQLESIQALTTLIAEISKFQSLSQSIEQRLTHLLHENKK